MGKSISHSVREQAKDLALQGKSSRDIARITGISQSTAYRIIKSNEENIPTQSRGRPRILDTSDERYIARLATTGKCSTATEIQQELHSYAGMTTSRNTIMRALNRCGIVSRYKKKRPQLKRAHRRARRDFEIRHRGWTDSHWDRVIWSDETKINLRQSDGRERTLRRIGSELRDHDVVGTHKHGGGSIIVWGCMLSLGVGYLCRIDGGVNADMYLRILNDELLKTLEWYQLGKEEVIFQQDNPSCHTASSVKEWFETQRIKVLSWPAQSPDLNPIEHLWDHVKQELRKLPPAANIDQLWEQVQDIWNAIDVSTCLNLVRSMPHRLAAVRSAKGGYTMY